MRVSECPSDFVGDALQGLIHPERQPSAGVKHRNSMVPAEEYEHEMLVEISCNE